MLQQRVLTALLLAPLAIAIILLLSTPWIALVGAAVFLGAMEEWTRLANVQKPASRMALLVSAAVLFALLWLGHAGALMPLLLVLGVAWWLLACLWLRHFALGAAPTPENRTLKLAAGAFVIFPAWVALIALHGREVHGHWWLLLALVIVWAADIGAYFSGRTFGKRKLAPQISPGKTWAGAYGAMVAGVLVALAGGWLLDVRDTALLGLGVLAAITVAVSIVGDLLESLMKRHAGMKDSGSVFPGHGGLLDRLDSVFAALPVFALGLQLLGL
ncbi:phosphatidate cytidylyltransferase [Rhodanobacter sp. 7MK24]|uniref:phosphatidate cytidylyltransferase n=1 Tax=Rhodanobacter sp. 7MK24 TaxID=2775922 RepID=UPI00177DE7C6|nr:phosphatidate cytidylyltransferase [Rhodanobacter sp. 7MK24]MBD8879183.1 phosphatidate cytidylyltransferase [Rhodanobacter sp. 7MK24]